MWFLTMTLYGISPIGYFLALYIQCYLYRTSAGQVRAEAWAEAAEVLAEQNEEKKANTTASRSPLKHADSSSALYLLVADGDL